MKSSRLDGTVWGWMWMIGFCLMLFGSAMWAVTGFLAGEALGSFSLIGPSLVAIGALSLGARHVLKPKA